MIDAPQLKWHFIEPLWIANPSPTPGIDVVFTQPVRAVLPEPIAGARAAELTGDEQRELRAAKVAPRNVYRLDGRVRLPIPAGQRWRVHLVASGTGRGELSVVALQGGRVVGGSTYVIRAPRN